MKYISIVLSLFFVACNQHSAQTGVMQVPVIQPEAKFEKDNFEKGKVINPVALHSDAAQSFALFLPQDYSESVKFPVIIFFDPHGDGNIPLDLYHAEADKAGYILIGSNNSKNGMSFEQTNVIANNLISELKTRFSIDAKRIMLCGFSGGAKVALLSGAANADVSSIIYCGAIAQINPNHPVSLLGIAGMRDMNYSDVILFNQSLASSIEHYLLEWNGKHEWSSPEVFKTAFTFPFSSIPKNKLAMIDLKKLSDLTNEDNIKHGLMQDFETQDLTWWKKKIAELHAQKKSGPMFERLLGFVSLACYSFSKNALAQHKLAIAEKILSIYQMADPGNKDCENFTAELNEQKKGR